MGTRFGRRRFVRSAFAATVAAVAAGQFAPLRADRYRPPDGYAGKVAPPIVYIPETGHHMEGPFARFWHNLGGVAVLGYPISETVIEGGLRTQYFENARLQYLPAGQTLNGEIQVSPLGAMLLPDGSGRFPLPVGAEFAAFYTANHGAVVLGDAISVPHYAGSQWVQWFRNGKLALRHLSNSRSSVTLASLGREAAGLANVRTEPVAAEPGALGPDPRNFTRWFDANLTTQILQFWEASYLVHETTMSSGRKRPTPEGEFFIYRRVPNETMISDVPPDHPDYYNLPNVLYTQYFSPWFDALHYAYWHNNFGRPMSHGCLNLRLADSRLAWEFGGIGTAVVTHR